MVIGLYKVELSVKEHHPQSFVRLPDHFIKYGDLLAMINVGFICWDCGP